MIIINLMYTIKFATSTNIEKFKIISFENYPQILMSNDTAFKSIYCL